ncbi:hypothetical protein ACN27F_28265 [Solwaraspora sp. WMMB335]|uniref:hypothetical protein n=1 Tax=Solwaraspora sp. WMMB335 TaxID=3404118 RepID=UPI003B931738
MSALARVGRGHRRVGGDLEHGYDSPVGELDFGDEGLDGGLAFGVAAAGHDRAEVVADRGDGSERWWRGLGGETGVEFGVPGVELGQPLAEFADARAGGGVVHGAVLERGVIPGDAGFGGGDLVGEGGEFGAAVVGGGVALGVGAFDHGVEEGFGGGVEVVQGLQYGVVEFVGG